MIYPIVKYGDPVLEKAAATITAFDEELKKLVEDMFESMYAARGVGLAAPQIGISKRIAVVDVTFKEDPNAKLVLINPEILSKEGRQRSSEGCLSIPDLRGEVPRFKQVRVQALGRKAEPLDFVATDFHARVIQHETDHLKGEVYLDRMPNMRSLSHLAEWQRYLLPRSPK